MAGASQKDKIDAYGLDAVCADLANGITLTETARKLTVTVGALLAWAEADQDRSARVREARTRAARLWDEKAVEVIEKASDPFEMTKAKELAHHYRWRASKTAPREYGDRTTLAGDPDAPLNQADTRPEPASFLVEWTIKQGKK